MDRRNYESKAIGLFDTIGSYFVDMLYNNHYLISRDLVRRGLASNITDAYRSTVVNYMNGSSRDDLFKITVCKLHEYYQRNSGFGTIVLSEFQDKILSQFIPAEYYQDFTDRHKDLILKEIVVRTIKDFGDVVLTPRYLSQIIDNHLNKDNVTQLQDHIVDIFILQREEYYTRFAKEISKRNASDTVDRATLDKLKAAYMDEKRKCCELAADKERATSIVGQLIDKIKVLEAKIVMLERSVGGAVDGVSEVNAISSAAPHRADMFTNTNTSLPRTRIFDSSDRGRSDVRGGSLGAVSNGNVGSNVGSDGNANNNANITTNSSNDNNVSNNGGNRDIKSVTVKTTHVGTPRARRDQTPYPPTRIHPESDDSDDSGPDDEEIHRRQQEAIISSRSGASMNSIVGSMMANVEVDRALSRERGWERPHHKHTNIKADIGLAMEVPTTEVTNVTAMYTLDDDPWVTKD